MPIQKRTVSGAGKPAEPKQPKAQAAPLKANPVTAHTLQGKHKTERFNATTMLRMKPQ